MIAIQDHIIDVRKTPFYIIGAIALLLALAIPEKPGLSNIKVYFTLGIFVFWGLIIYVFSKTKIIITNDGIIFKNLFRKESIVLWNNIIASKLEWHFHGKSASDFWRLDLPEGNSKGFQPSLYSRKNLRLIAEAMIEKCPNALIDKRIMKMSEGKFPWYLF